ncbi:MAG: bifunctional phosphopantothenoylcysteine decarboxylase/phosphopantothenate--cysteine ligase CoaBC [Bacteroidales bacterium]
MLKGKKIILGLTGSIAAYKAAFLVRLLVREEAEVQVVMTPMACDFITPLTLSTLSGKPVMIDFSDPDDGSWNNHVELGLWADLFLVAPASANTMAKMAAGIADNLLLTVFLSARCPVWVVPAMDMDMYLHPATQRNISALESLGVRVLEPETGPLASGLTGKGRMEEPEKIMEEVTEHFKKKKSCRILRGKKILINAGPTYEVIDAVRFIGNRSSGKMGVALASVAAEAGAYVTLVLGPVSQQIAHPSVSVIRVESAAEMYEKTLAGSDEADIIILAAAVSDFTPEEPVRGKIKRGKAPLVIRLKPTVDIAAAIGRKKKPGQVLVGFALETDNEQEHAREKLAKKNLDIIVLNSLAEPGAGFGYDTNRVTIIDRLGHVTQTGLKPKTGIAGDIMEKISGWISQQEKR